MGKDACDETNLDSAVRLLLLLILLFFLFLLVGFPRPAPSSNNYRDGTVLQRHVAELARFLVEDDCRYDEVDGL